VRVDHVEPTDGRRERRRILLKTARVYVRSNDLIAGAKANEVSLAVFKPERVLDFFWEEEDREWSPEKLRQMREGTDAVRAFSDDAVRTTFKVIPSCRTASPNKFEDAAGRISELQVLDLGDRAPLLELPARDERQRGAALAKVRRSTSTTS
jgi:hypothetical protein